MSQFDTLSPVFRDSLRVVADGMAKKAQCDMAPAPQGTPQKEAAVLTVLEKVTQFNERFVKEWLYGMEEQDLGKVAELFDEINSLSVTDAQSLMGKSGQCCPFGLVASMFGGAAEGGGEIEVVVEEDPSAPPPTEPAETRQEQEPNLLNTLIEQQ